MKKLLARIRKILRDRRTRQLLTRIVSITAAVVVFITTYALVLPAITMESEANCGIPAHQHDDNCYEDRLICGQVESPGHQHTDACYSISKSLICTETEHQHDDSCFDEDGNLTCELAEHTHDDSCYEEVHELVCSIPESEGHEHTDDCYDRVLACGMEAHTHSTACYSHGSELTAAAPSDFAAVATTELGSFGATVSASTATEANSEETSNTWASDESAAGGLSSTAAAATDAAADYSSTATAADTASTGFDSATTEDAFVPQLEPIYFEQLLTKDTDIYYYHAEEGEEVPENSADIADWKRVNDNTELASTDLLRVYLRYSIPAGALNATNDIARYRLPSNLHLTDQQMEAINTTVNGIANQYVNLDTLEITDTERYNTYLGIEATEGTRKPSDNIDEYFTNHPNLEGQEYINAVVRAENVFDETTEEYLGQDLVFTFTPYTVQKNQHEYDAEGQPTKAGQKVNGWLCFDLHMDQIDWSEPVITTIEDDPVTPAQDVPVENTEDTNSSDTTEATEKAASDMDEDASLSSSNPDALSTNTITEKKDSSAEIVFAAEDKALKIDEISTELHQVELNTIEKENDGVQDEPDQSADDSTNNANSEMTDGEGDAADDTNPEGEADKSESADASAADTENQPESAMEINAETYPAVSFEDMITVQAGTLSTDNESAAQATPAEATITVSVIAEEETFPLGTTMQLGTVEDMATVASAVEGAVEGQTRGFHAVDISFHNADGEEIEPLKPIKVSMTSDSIKQAVEDSSTAPVVVHVESPVEPVNPTEHENTTSSDELNDPSTNGADAVANSEDLDSRLDHVAETSENAPSATIVETAETTGTDRANGAKDNTDTLTFDVGSFSVYAIVYTVDFHYEVDGKTYEFSIPGGGFVSLEHLVEVLGIARIGENTTDSGENQAIEGENVAENGENLSDSDAYNEVEETDVEENGENTGSSFKESINLNSVEVSVVTKQFVADVASVKFSSPELVWVGKVEETTTVGGLKETNGLEVQYSAELTEEQIAEINSSTVEGGDWALISLLPFTSEEMLMITMEDGNQFVVKVTDANRPYKVASELVDGTYIIYTSAFSYLTNSGGTTNTKPTSPFTNYTWNVTKNWNGTYTITSTKDGRYLNLYGNVNANNQVANGTYATVTLGTGDSGITVYCNGKYLANNGSAYYPSYSAGNFIFYNVDNYSESPSSFVDGIVLSEAEKQALINWKNSLDNRSALTDYNKTAEQDDYDNRIYKINISAESGIRDFYKTVDLGFALDVSNSMKFPSSLEPLTNNSGNVSIRITGRNLTTLLNSSSYKALYQRQNCFYIISDPAVTSTVYRVFYEGSLNENNWKAVDASDWEAYQNGTLASNKIHTISNTTGYNFKEPFIQNYTVYYAGDTLWRRDYLQSSLNSALATMEKIVAPTGSENDQTSTVRVAYNLFASEVKSSDDFKDLRQNQTFRIQVAGNEASGTKQNLALYDSNYNPRYSWTKSTPLSANEFGWTAGNDQYVILITDGAPNGPTMDDVRTAASNLKTQWPNVKIITIGLSTQDVDGGSQMLYDIADSVNGVKQFYEAEKANDLEAIMLKILQSIMAKAVVKGTITDTIDKAFYPVDSNGNPISEGVYKNGSRIQGADPSTYTDSDSYYVWEQINGTWRITWYNQPIGWNDGDASTGNPWNGAIFVKAKEDYLGGNLLETNESASIQPTGFNFIVDGNVDPFYHEIGDADPEPLPVPRVNVHNLESDEKHTVWTVYKGTSVTPKDALKALWNEIPIEEVVTSTKDSNHKITTGQSANIGTAGTGEKFGLGKALLESNPEFKIEDLINQLSVDKTEVSKSFEYKAYGHASGTITVKIKRVVGNEAVTTHTTDTVASPAEKYSIEVTYTPYSETERMAGKVKNPSDANHHNGPAGRGAEERGTITSTNTHTINVFVKKFQILKRDKDTKALITDKPATFTLYKSKTGAAPGTEADLSNTTNYEAIATLTTATSGTNAGKTNEYIVMPLTYGMYAEGASKTTTYYLAETSEPDGYTKCKTVWPVTLTLTETPTGTAGAAVLASGEAYNWTQTGTLTVGDQGSAGDSNTITVSITVDNELPKAADIEIIKIDSETGNDLPGAVFQLYTKSPEELVNVDTTSPSYSGITGLSPVTLDSKTYGSAFITMTGTHIYNIGNIPEGTYVLKETKIPDGYGQTGGDIEFTISNGEVTVTDYNGTSKPISFVKKRTGETEDTNTFTIENEPGVALPNTGGHGTTALYLLGIMLTGLAGASLLMRSKRGENEA